MKKVMINYWLDLLALVAFALLTSTGVLMEYTLPERSGQRYTVLGLSRHEWGDLHFYIALSLFATLSLHILLHWKWIVNLTRGHASRTSRRRLLLGLLALLTLILLSAAPLLVPVETTASGAGYGHGAPQH